MTGVHVLPKSEVLYAYGFMSPNVCRSKVAYAVASSQCPGSTLETQAFFGRPEMLATTFVHVLPASRVTWTFPSSGPTQITLVFFGDSAMAQIVVCISAEELSTVTPPDCSCFCFAGSFVVRSPEMRSHVWPWSFDLKRNCDPR